MATAEQPRRYVFVDARGGRTELDDVGIYGNYVYSPRTGLVFSLKDETPQHVASGRSIASALDDTKGSGGGLFFTTGKGAGRSLNRMNVAQVQANDQCKEAAVLIHQLYTMDGGSVGDHWIGFNTFLNSDGPVSDFTFQSLVKVARDRKCKNRSRAIVSLGHVIEADITRFMDEARDTCYQIAKDHGEGGLQRKFAIGALERFIVNPRSEELAEDYVGKMREVAVSLDPKHYDKKDYWDVKEAAIFELRRACITGLGRGDRSCIKAGKAVVATLGDILGMEGPDSEQMGYLRRSAAHALVDIAHMRKATDLNLRRHQDYQEISLAAQSALGDWLCITDPERCAGKINELRDRITDPSNKHPLADIEMLFYIAAFAGKNTSLKAIDAAREVQVKLGEGRETDRKRELYLYIIEENVYFVNYCQTERRDRDLEIYAERTLVRDD